MTKLNVFTFVALTIGSAVLCACCVSPDSPSTLGWRPSAPMGTSTMLRMTAHPTATTGPIGLLAGSFSEPVPGSTAQHGFFGHVDNRFDPHHGYSGPLPGTRC